jgi:hypothetical protein
MRCTVVVVDDIPIAVIVVSIRRRVTQNDEVEQVTHCKHLSNHVVVACAVEAHAVDGNDAVSRAKPPRSSHGPGPLNHPQKHLSHPPSGLIRFVLCEASASCVHFETNTHRVLMRARVD